jgi:hypothetical protein
MRRLRQLRDDCPSPAPNGYSWGQNGANHPKHKRFTATRRILNEVVKPVRVLGGCCVWCAGLVEGAVTEHGPQDVEASSGQGQDGLGVVLWEVDSVFCGRLHALVGPDTLPWAVWYRRKSFAGGGSRPLGRSRPPPPKADVCPRPARMLPVILPVICGVKSFNTEIKLGSGGALASFARASGALVRAAARMGTR